MSALTTEQIEAIEAKGGKRWQKNDMDRLYINAKDLGLKVEYYKSGNICNSWFDGEYISHAEAYRAMNSKVWIDVKTGELCTRFERIDSSIKDAMVERAQAILDEATAEPETVDGSVEENNEESSFNFTENADGTYRLPNGMDFEVVNNGDTFEFSIYTNNDQLDSFYSEFDGYNNGCVDGEVSEWAAPIVGEEIAENLGKLAWNMFVAVTD